MSENNSDNKSYIHGVSLVPLMGITIGDCFDQAVQNNPDSLALSAQ